MLEELGRLAFLDLGSFFDTGGNLKPMADLTTEQSSCLSSFEVIKRNAPGGNGLVDTIYRIRTWDKIRALELLAKHFGLLTEKAEQKSDIIIRWQREAE